MCITRFPYRPYKWSKLDLVALRDRPFLSNFILLVDRSSYNRPACSEINFLTAHTSAEMFRGKDAEQEDILDLMRHA